MSEELIEKILEQGRIEARRIIEEAEEEARRILEEAKVKARREVDEKIEAIKRGAEERATMIRHVAEVKARMAYRLRILEEKNKIIEEVFKAAYERLNKLTETDEYLGVLKELIIEAAVSIGGGQLKVIAPQHHEKAVKKLDFQRIAKAVEGETGNRTEFDVTFEPLKVSGGVIVETKDGRVMFDNTFEGRMKRLRSMLVKEIGSILFPKRRSV
ncbi:hypothetical protein KEJ27_00250 [Candidatus Bathyarchaeota archaeon]|nr:hypothetical protein [Candidatus Bathyarchaeota archaeon]MBS7617152.1 hypothetical protein [Candidatus Bathyarchaeota archaeon]